MCVKISAVTAICFLLSGCLGLFGFWMDGNPAVGENITPARDYWMLPNGTAEERSRQWIACGGFANGRYESSVVTPEERHLSTPELFAVGWEKNRKAQLCMMKAGYQYIGTCTGTIPSVYAICQQGVSDQINQDKQSAKKESENQ